MFLFKNILQSKCLYVTLRRSISDRRLTVGVIQSNVVKEREKNLVHAYSLIKNCAASGAELIVLGECFNSPYGIKYFKQYGESIPDGPTSQMLSNAAREFKVFIHGGTFPEKQNDKYYNTSTVWSPHGELIQKYRKMHLFDIDIPNVTSFSESELLSSGDTLSTFTIKDIKIGLGICYDIRFDELAKVYRNLGCEVIIYPGAFTMKTGETHWDLLQQSRAVQNQVFIITASPATSKKGYITWAHSSIVDPWGKILCQAKHEEEILIQDIDMNVVQDVRQQIPTHHQRRTDIYDTITKNDLV